MNAKLIAGALVVGLLVGALTTWLLSANQITQEEQDWLAQRTVVAMQRRADSVAVAQIRAAKAEAEAKAAAALDEANRQRHLRQQAEADVASARGALAGARDLRDSMTAALRVIASQDVALARAKDEAAGLRVTIAEQAVSQQQAAAELAAVTTERDRLQHLVDAAPVGKHPPKLFGVIPMPKCGPGAGAVVAGGRVEVGLGAACIVPL